MVIRMIIQRAREILLLKERLKLSPRFANCLHHHLRKNSITIQENKQKFQLCTSGATLSRSSSDVWSSANIGQVK